MWRFVLAEAMVCFDYDLLFIEDMSIDQDENDLLKDEDVPIIMSLFDE